MLDVPLLVFETGSFFELVLGEHHEFTVGVEGEGSCFAMRVVHPLLMGH